ncbi:MAG: uracil phosphoribosyltransferase, partial [Verrucomicrobia bacterium]|nr:uracil phosphoribosyltransferase [Verrucomicrobiota bacterium]
MKSFLVAFLLSNGALFAQTQALSQYVYEIRNPKTDAVHFRQSLEKIGEILAFDLLEELSTKEVVIETLTGKEAKHLLIDDTPVLVTILRAGLPLNTGIQRVFPNAEVGFLAMARNEETLKAATDYIALPDIAGKTVILSDTMLATGGSLIDAIRIIEKGSPKKLFIITAIASKAGIERITKHNPEIKIFAAAIDASLSDKGYILPGLGDAGDRAYGKKHS